MTHEEKARKIAHEMLSGNGFCEAEWEHDDACNALTAKIAAALKAAEDAGWEKGWNEAIRGSETVLRENGANDLCLILPPLRSER